MIQALGLSTPSPPTLGEILEIAAHSLALSAQRRITRMARAAKPGTSE